MAEHTMELFHINKYLAHGKPEKVLFIIYTRHIPILIFGMLVFISV